MLKLEHKLWIPTRWPGSLSQVLSQGCLDGHTCTSAIIPWPRALQRHLDSSLEQLCHVSLLPLETDAPPLLGTRTAFSNDVCLFHADAGLAVRRALFPESDSGCFGRSQSEHVFEALSSFSRGIWRHWRGCRVNNAVYSSL